MRERMRVVAIVFAALALLAWYFWATAPEEPQLRQYRTDERLVVGIPAAFAVAAWLASLVGTKRR
jgi:hypothetical protein